MANLRNKQTGIESSGTFIVRGDVKVGQTMHTTQALKQELEEAFRPVQATIASEHPESAQEAAMKLNELKTILEMGKASGTEDKKAAGLLESIQSLAPKAASAIVKAFATPVLAALTGPATEYVLEKLHIPGLGT
jgi:hypothetical protein